jgi:hypothetical protein
MVTIASLFGNNSLSTQKMRRIAQTIQRGRGGQCAAPQIESRAIADSHTSRSPHTFGKRGHPSTWICVQICKAPHSIRTALRAAVVVVFPLAQHSPRFGRGIKKFTTHVWVPRTALFLKEPRGCSLFEKRQQNNHLMVSFSWLYPLQLHLTYITNLLSQYGGRLLPLAARARKRN